MHFTYAVQGKQRRIKWQACQEHFGVTVSQLLNSRTGVADVLSAHSRLRLELSRDGDTKLITRSHVQACLHGKA
jgi:hypothetical protein